MMAQMGNQAGGGPSGPLDHGITDDPESDDDDDGPPPLEEP